MPKVYKLVNMTQFLGHLAKCNYSTLALPRPHIVCCMQPSEVWYNSTWQVLVVWLSIHLLPSSQQSTPELFFSLCISSLLKGAARNKSMWRVPPTSGRSAHMSAYWPLCWREKEDWEGPVYPWKWTGLSLHWSPPNRWVALCDAWFGGHGGFCTVCGINILEFLLLLSV